LVLCLISPVDLLPKVASVLGLVDDLVLIQLAMRWMSGRLPPHIIGQATENSARRAGEV
jgi:uncharacterized membrane protein YkvA (DUF1232 family)